MGEVMSLTVGTADACSRGAVCLHRPVPRLQPSRGVLAVLLVVSLVVHVVGLYDPTPSGGSVPVSDKLVHALLFGVPALLGGLLGAGLWWPSLLVLHAPVSELVQARLIAPRTGDPWDAVADVVGVAVGWWLARALRQRARRRSAEVPSADIL